jgi:hypothetical protein
MTSSSPLFDHWSRIDHSAPIGIVTILTVILGFMVYAAGMIIKFTSPDMKSKPWWNNFFSTLTAVRLYTCEPDHLSGTLPRSNHVLTWLQVLVAGTVHRRLACLPSWAGEV